MMRDINKEISESDCKKVICLNEPPTAVCEVAGGGFSGWCGRAKVGLDKGLEGLVRVKGAVGGSRHGVR